MKLGTQTGSVINHLQSIAVIGQPEPVVGMGVTILSWTDRSPGTIVEVFTHGKYLFIAITGDDYKLIGGDIQSESQEYEYTSRPNGRCTYFRREESGKWQQMTHKIVGYDEEKDEHIFSTRWSKVEGGGNGLRIGARDCYRDPTF
jgi:hypothetical protein